MTTPPSRRARRHRESVEEILGAARTTLAAAGPAAVTLRGLATDLGMAASGVHYYFPARDDLLAALIVDGFTDLAGHVSRASTGPADRPALHRWRAGALAYRSWAQEHAELFELAHSRAATRLKVAPGLLEAKDTVVQALMAPLFEAVRTGEAAAPAPAVALGPALREQLHAWAAATHDTLPDEQRLAALFCYTSLQGNVLLTLSGSLPRELLTGDAVFRAHLEELTAPWVAAVTHPRGVVGAPGTAELIR